MPGLKRLKLFIIGVTASFIALGLAPAWAASSGNISHSYHSTGSIATGSIVSLDPKHTGYLEPANTANGSHLLGVTVPIDDSLIAVDPTNGTVQVATSGSVNVLVSTLNGDINIGDKITVSPFNGVGMEALPGTPYVIGLAQTAFTAESKDATIRQVTDKAGHTSQIHLGYVRLSIAIGSYASSAGTGLNSLQKFILSLNGHVVSTARIIAGLVVAVVALVALVTLIYASIYSSILSIGRNPLIKDSILLTLFYVLVLAAITGVVAGAAIFFLLR